MIDDKKENSVEGDIFGLNKRVKTSLKRKAHFIKEDINTIDYSSEKKGINKATSNEGNWYCFPCYTGLLALDCYQEKWQSRYLDIQTKDNANLKNIDFQVSRGEKEYLIPHDLKIDKIAESAPLPIQLTNYEIESIDSAEKYNTYAATSFGPLSNDKASNEDFTISSAFHVDDNDEEVFRFVAVADGVSTKTLWPARASRIACLVTLRTVQREVLKRPDALSDNVFLEKLRDLVTKNIVSYLQEDKKILIKGEYISSKSSEEFQTRSIDSEELWYNTTLLYSCLGNKSGFVVWIGDGGVSINKIDRDGTIETVEPLRSTDDVQITSFISLSGKSAHAQMANLTNAMESSNSIQLFLSSDGVDRTLDLNKWPYHSNSKAFKNSVSIASFLDRVSEPNFIKKFKRDDDNYSLAKIVWNNKDNMRGELEQENELTEELYSVSKIKPDNLKKKKTQQLNDFDVGLLMYLVILTLTILVLLYFGNANKLF